MSSFILAFIRFIPLDLGCQLRRSLSGKAARKQDLKCLASLEISSPSHAIYLRRDTLLPRSCIYRMSGVHLSTFGGSPRTQTAQLGQNIPNQISRKDG